MTQPVRVFRAGERPQTSTTQTPGMRREELTSTADSWAGITRMPPGAVSGWHHHGDYESYIYGISGRIRLEYGAGGKESSEGGPGDVFYVPRGVVHREVTPGPDEGVVFVVRVGKGEPVINVDGPAQ